MRRIHQDSSKTCGLLIVEVLMNLSNFEMLRLFRAGAREESIRILRMPESKNADASGRRPDGLLLLRV